MILASHVSLHAGWTVDD